MRAFVERPQPGQQEDLKFLKMDKNIFFQTENPPQKMSTYSVQVDVGVVSA